MVTKVIIRRKQAAKMITVIVYHPVLQEYMTLPMPAGSIAKVKAAVAAQYPVEDHNTIHIVTVLDGVCTPSPSYEAEVAL